MKISNHLFTAGIACLLSLSSCQKEKNYIYQAGNPTLDVKTDVSKALFGDSMQFEVEVADSEIALSTLKAQLFFTDDKVSEVTIRTKNPGKYNGTIYVPFLKNVPNGKATIKFIVENISQKKNEKSFDIDLSRPDYPYLDLVTEGKTYKLLKVANNQYALTDNLPFSIKGYIQAPKVGSNGNILNFGWLNNTIGLGSTTVIPFSNSTSGVYTINFNTLTYEASPFIIAYAINGTVFSRIDDDHYKAELNLNKGDKINFTGIENVADWWIDTDFFTKDQAGALISNVIDGKYRITADFTKKYFIVEAMDGNNLSSLKADGTGALWIIGEGVGKPNVANNQVGWNTDKALCLAPIGNKKYQITLTGDKTVKLDNINFKFFHQKGWGGEFKSEDISTTSDIIFIGDGKNGRDSGNLGILAGKNLEKDKSYVLTVDLSEGNNKAKLIVNNK